MSETVKPYLVHQNYAEEVDQASEKLYQYVIKTPIVTSEELDKLAGLELVFKCENLQKTGSFKVRGAVNSILTNQSERKLKGVVGQSSGNFGIGLSYAAHKMGVPCALVLTEGTPQNKVKSIQDLGAEVVYSPKIPKMRLDVTLEEARKRDYEYLSSYSRESLIGFASIGMELSQQIAHFDGLVASVATGGMISSISYYLHTANRSVRVFAVEPEGKKLAKSLSSGYQFDHHDYLDTVAHSLQFPKIEDDVFHVFKRMVKPKDVITVTNSEMMEGVSLALKHLKLVVEPAAGASIIACLKIRKLCPKIKKLAVIICGGNVDSQHLVDADNLLETEQKLS